MLVSKILNLYQVVTVKSSGGHPGHPGAGRPLLERFVLTRCFSHRPVGGHRGEYFYSVGVQGLQVIFFSSCRNIQFGVFCAEIFILWCIVQEYFWRNIHLCPVDSVHPWSNVTSLLCFPEERLGDRHWPAGEEQRWPVGSGQNYAGEQGSSDKVWKHTMVTFWFMSFR